MKRVILLVVAIIAACIIFFGCSTTKQNNFSLHETSQTYVLQCEDSFATVPTVTLYENGSARLSQPLISSYAIFGIGKYEIDGNKLTVAHNDSSSATFEISDDGDTLTLLSANLSFIPECEVRKWLDYFGSDRMPWNESKKLTLTEFPGVTFTWTSEKVTAGEKELFWGMPVWNVYLADLTNDGKPEFCATVSIGSGITDNRIIVFDYVTDKEYQLSDRMYYNYFLSLDNGKLMVTQTDYLGNKPLVTAELRLVNGEIFRFGNSIENKNFNTD